eukprot:g297.t1
MLNHHDWWENNWGRSDAAWPRKGFQECWQNRGNVCPLPNQNGVVCLPGSRRGSTINRGWALDPKSQACKPGVHCLYACEPGYYWTTYNQAETSNYDFVNAHQRGNCDGTWDYGTSSHGVYCKEDGTLALPSQPLCALGETFVYAENRLDTHVFLCQTVFPGHEIFLIPTLVKPGETVMITTQPKHFWHGPTYSNPTHGDIYVSFAGADIMEACTWDEFSPSGAALLPYEIGTGIEDNGQLYSTHYFYQQPNSEVPAHLVGFTMDLECESTDPGICNHKVAHNNVITLITFKKPSPGSTKVKFVFNKPGVDNNAYVYQEPNKAHIPDPMTITGLKSNARGGYSPYQHPYVNNIFGHNGRKLKSVQEGISFLENTLTEPIIACGTDNGALLPGMSVGPGEIIQLPEEGTFFIGLKGDSWFACSDMSNLRWVIDIGLDESSKNKSFSFRPHLNTGSLDEHLGYNIQLKCTSENDECTAQDGNKVTLLAASYKDSETEVPEVIFMIKGITTTGSSNGSSSSSYKWGTHLTKFIASSLKLNTDNTKSDIMT